MLAKANKKPVFLIPLRLPHRATIYLHIRILEVFRYPPTFACNTRVVVTTRLALRFVHSSTIALGLGGAVTQQSDFDLLPQNVKRRNNKSDRIVAPPVLKRNTAPKQRLSTAWHTEEQRARLNTGQQAASPTLPARLPS